MCPLKNFVKDMGLNVTVDHYLTLPEGSKRFWKEIIVGQMKNVAEAYAVLMTAKKFIDGIGESIASLTRMDLGEIADLGGGEISQEHLIAKAIMAKDCGPKSMCSDAWDLLY